MGTLIAVCRVHQLLPDAGTVGVTAIDKRPVDGPVRVRALGAHGDVQADRYDHGGRDKALYAYAQEAADRWVAALQRDVPPGLFGENLRTAGVDVDGAEIGERWRLGGGDDALEVEVTMPPHAVRDVRPPDGGGALGAALRALGPARRVPARAATGDRRCRRPGGRGVAPRARRGRRAVDGRGRSR